MQALDLNSLTLGEIADFEDVSGCPFNAMREAINSGEQPIGKMLIGLALIRARRADPTATIDTVRAMRLDEFIVNGDDPVPLPPPSAPSA